MYPLTLDDTVDTLVDRLRADRLAQHQAAVDTATTNLGRLLAAGVVSYDDGLSEWTREAEQSAAKAEAKRRGQEPNAQNVAAIIEEWARERDREQVRNDLSYCVAFGETPAELHVRVAAALEAAPTGTKHDNKRPCQHRATRKHRGWVNPYGVPGELLVRDDAGVVVLGCSRCGVLVKVLQVSTRTEQSKIAEVLLTQMVMDAELAASRGAA
jgi:hypothetical protein